MVLDAAALGAWRLRVGARPPRPCPLPLFPGRPLARPTTPKVAKGSSSGTSDTLSYITGATSTSAAEVLPRTRRRTRRSSIGGGAQLLARATGGAGAAVLEDGGGNAGVVDCRRCVGEGVDGLAVLAGGAGPWAWVNDEYAPQL